MQHPSETLVQESEAAVRGHEREQLARRIRWLAEAYRAESDIDSDGLRQSIIAIEEPGSLIPLSPPGLRGSVGGWAIKLQEAALWWIVRAFRIRDHALRAMHTTLVRQARMRDAREREMLRRMGELELRVRAVERQAAKP